MAGRCERVAHGNLPARVSRGGAREFDGACAYRVAEEPYAAFEDR
jgi:hypothetical protein